MSSRGHNRERRVRDLLIADDWFVIRAPGSLGVADIVALKDGKTPLMIEVKSTAGGPYHSFGPQDRSELSLAATMAGALAYLVWWPPRGKPQWLHESSWPIPNRRTRCT